MNLSVLLASVLLASTPLASAPPLALPIPVVHPGRLVLAVEGQGVQVYRCLAAPGSPTWVLDHPDATLFDPSGAAVGKHFAGPTWRYKDGSEVVGQRVSQSPGKRDGDAPWLVLRVVSHHGHGVLGSVESITRTNTDGGAAPSFGCTAANLGRTQIVPYRALYSFYARP